MIPGLSTGQGSSFQGSSEATSGATSGAINVGGFTFQPAAKASGWALLAVSVVSVLLILSMMRKK